jgi:hypothetical protein
MCCAPTGVQIVTGMTINDFYAVLAAFGAGFDFMVGGGFTIHTGVSLNQWNGPMYNVSGPFGRAVGVCPQPCAELTSRVFLVFWTGRVGRILVRGGRGVHRHRVALCVLLLRRLGVRHGASPQICLSL